MARVHPSPGCCELNRFALPFLRLVFLRVHVHHRKILPAYPTFHVVDPTSTPVAPFPASTSMRYRRASWKPPNHCTAHPCPYPCHPLTFVPCQSVPLICRVGAECRNEISCIFVQDLARGGTGILNQSGSVYGFGGGSPPTCVLYLSHLTAPIRLLIYIFSFQDMSTICGIVDFHMLPRLRDQHDCPCSHFIWRRVPKSFGSRSFLPFFSFTIICRLVASQFVKSLSSWIPGYELLI